MPRVKPLGRLNPQEVEVRAWIGAGMGALQMNQAELARRAGLDKQTLSNRIGRSGDIGSMRLKELWAIRKVFRQAGYEGTTIIL